MTDTSENAITIRGVTKIFGDDPQTALAMLRDGKSKAEVQAETGQVVGLDAVSLDIARGQIFVVMGLSGSGKSTLIRHVNRLIEPTAGDIFVGGENVLAMSAEELRAFRRKSVAMVFQKFGLLPHRSVIDNVAYGLEVRGVGRRERREAAAKWIETVGLAGYEDARPRQLSGGQQQRVGLARALALDTDIVLMDEAFSALDPLIRSGMQDQLLELQKTLNKTILFITHDLNEAMRLGDRIAMMRDGRVVQVGTAEQILNNPANDYVAQFVQDVDWTRVLTAASVMEPPVAVLGSLQGPRAAHRLLREHQISALMVVDRERRLRGVVLEDDVVSALSRGQESLDGLVQPAVTVRPDVPVADLFGAAADSPAALAVVEDDRLIGVIPRVTLLSALGSVGGKETGNNGIGTTAGAV